MYHSAPDLAELNGGELGDEVGLLGVPHEAELVPRVGLEGPKQDPKLRELAPL